VRGVLAAWAADEELLGRDRAVRSTLAAALARGELKAQNVTDLPRNPSAYVAALLRFLASAGYRR
jgi:hypothetical protein